MNATKMTAAGLLVAAAIAGLVFGWIVFDRGTAGLPDSALGQSAKATASGFAIEAKTADFSGTFTRLELAVQPVENHEDNLVAGLGPLALGGFEAGTALVLSRDGGVFVLRLPPVSTPVGEPAVLTITSLLLRSDHGPVPVSGEWRLVLDLPPSDALASLLADVERLSANSPADNVLDFVRASRSERETLVEYRLLEGHVLTALPRLRSGESLLAPLFEFGSGEFVTAVFPPTPRGSDVVLVFPELTMPSPGSDVIAVPVEHLLQTHGQPEPDGPIVAAVFPPGSGPESETLRRVHHFPRGGGVVTVLVEITGSRFHGDFSRLNVTDANGVPLRVSSAGSGPWRDVDTREIIEYRTNVSFDVDGIHDLSLVTIVSGDPAEQFYDYEVSLSSE
jgi:hypothetical protein